MSTLAKRLAEAQARLARLQAQRAIRIVSPGFANPNQFCAACGKDVPVTITKHLDGTLLSVRCETCGAELKDGLKGSTT